MYPACDLLALRDTTVLTDVMAFANIVGLMDVNAAHTMAEGTALPPRAAAPPLTYADTDLLMDAWHVPLDAAPDGLADEGTLPPGPPAVVADACYALTTFAATWLMGAPGPRTWRLSTRVSAC